MQAGAEGPEEHATVSELFDWLMALGWAAEPTRCLSVRVCRVVSGLVLEPLALLGLGEALFG
jgi:hypothetical protein